MNNNLTYALAGGVSLEKSVETLSSHWISAFAIRRNTQVKHLVNV